MRVSSYILAAIALASSAYAGLEDVKSTVTLTADNFDSAIAGKNALVAFFAPWCGHCKNLAPIWEKLGLDFKDEEKVLIGQLDADNADNRPTAQRYDVKGYPTIKWFPADGSAPQDYRQGRSEEAFLDFINSEAGTNRAPGGLLNNLAGRIPSLDTLVNSFLTASVDTRTSLVSQAKELAASFGSSASETESTAAKYYLRVFDKLSENTDWAKTELARLQKLAGKRSAMAGKQLDDLQVRQNILAAFTAVQAGASSVLSDVSASIDSATSRVAGSASSVSSVIAATASSAGASGSSVSSGAAASASSASSGVAASASSAASAASSQASTAYDQAAKVAGEAVVSGKSAASDVSASVEAAASAASASVASGVNAASAAASTAAQRIADEL